MADLPLPGCTPEPLMSYLKALGVFRLVAEQADPEARLSWRGGIAHLHSILSREQVEKFFLEQYKPTPIVGPWGARSGFYSGSSESSARTALDSISETTDIRLDSFRRIISAVRGILIRLGINSKENLDSGDTYIRLLRDLRNELPNEETNDGAGAWLDAVYTVGDERKFPPLLGTGGNEGSGSYMSNFCQLVDKLIVKREIDAGVASALFGTRAAVRTGVTVGHFAPGAIGGPNSSVGFGGGGGTNPWDFLLAIEGTLLFRSAVARRMGTDTDGKAAFPFTVNPNAVGYGSAANAEDARAELWMPEWSNNVTIDELKHLMHEGRAQLGRRQARSAIEFARAAVSLGVSSGLGGFHRYSLVKRNGLSYFAAYLGRFLVREIPNVRLIDQVDRWLASYRRVADDDNAPPRLGVAIRRIDAAVYDVCRYGDSAGYMQAVLRALGRAERELANAPKVRDKNSALRPLAGLSSDWLSACDDGTTEFRLALSLATMSARKGRHRPFRMYMEPVLPFGRKYWQFDDGVSGIVWSNTDLPRNLGAVLVRRQLDGNTKISDPVSETDDTSSAHPLWAPMRFRAALGDVLQFIENRTNDEIITDLVWALPAVNMGDRGFRFKRPSASGTLPADYAVLKLVHLTESVSRPGIAADVTVRNEPRIASLLRAERLDEAVELACRRLQISGLPPCITAPVAGLMKPVRGLPSTPDRCSRLLAALLFPLRPNAVQRLIKFSIREPQPETL